MQAIENAPPDPKATAKELTDRLFGYYDRQRAAEWEAELSAGRARAQAGDLKGAIDHFGWILAHDPNFARRGEMVEAYLRYGEALRRARRIPEALGYLRQAVDLDPSGPHAHEAAARVALLDGVQALAHGRAEPELFRRALALDPSLAEAKGLLERAEALRDRRKFLQGGAAAVLSEDELRGRVAAKAYELYAQRQAVTEADDWLNAERLVKEQLLAQGGCAGSV